MGTQMQMRRLIGLAVLVGLAAAVAAQPNVVVIVADDVGYGDVGYIGSEIMTPHLDQLAAEGVVLDRFYVASQCSPSRAGLLTGRYPIRMGIIDAAHRADTLGLPQSEVTLAGLLQDAGYATAMVGKWHLGHRCEYHPMAHGFDSFVGLLGSGADYFTRDTNAGLDWWRGYEQVEVEGYTTNLIADAALEVLDLDGDRPQFLYLPFTASHGPLGALEEDLALYPDLPDPRRTFAAITTRMDIAIGRVMEAVRAAERPTLVWFLTDNGATPAQGGSNGPLRGYKGITFEGGIRVPSVVWYPEWGTRTLDHPVWYLDVLPTILGLVPGAPTPPNPLDGADQGVHLAGAPPTDALLNRQLFSYRRLADLGYWLSAQNARHKYVDRLVPHGRYRYLFQIDTDPYEQVNRYNDAYDLASEMAHAAQAFPALATPGAIRDITLTNLDPPDFSTCEGNPAAWTSILIDGPVGVRYLGPPADGLTVDDLAAQHLVQGVPGFDTGAEPVTLFTAYDAATGGWTPSAGTGEVLRLGLAFRWRMLSGTALPFTLTTARAPNEARVRVVLDTGGSRMNLLANPFGVPLDLGTLASWPGAQHLVPGMPAWTYDPVTRTWEEASGVIGPWEAFRVRALGPRVANHPRVLVIPAPAAPAARASVASVASVAARPAALPRLAFTLSGADAEGLPVADRALTVRFRDGASPAFDPDEDVEKLQVPALAYALLGARTGDHLVGTDVRPFAPAEIPLAVEARGTRSAFTMSWDASTLPPGLPVTLVDLQTGAEVDMRTHSSIRFSAAPLPRHAEVPRNDLTDGAWAKDRFVVRIGETVAPAHVAISEVVLTSIAPNPSAGEAQVTFALPEAGPVRLTVLDVRGREVAVIVDGPRPAGRHAVTLDVGAMAAGVYTVRLAAGGTVRTRQAVIAR